MPPTQTAAAWLPENVGFAFVERVRSERLCLRRGVVVGGRAQSVRTLQLVRELLTFVGDGVSLVGHPVALVGDAVTFVGGGLSAVGHPVAFVGRPVALVGGGLSLVGHPVALVRGSTTFGRDLAPLLRVPEPGLQVLAASLGQLLTQSSRGQPHLLRLGPDLLCLRPGVRGVGTEGGGVDALLAQPGQ